MIWRSVFESFCLLRRESRLKVKKEKQPRIFGSTGLVSVFCFVICPRQEGLASDLAAHRLNGAQAAQNVFTGLAPALIRQKGDDGSFCVLVALSLLGVFSSVF